MKKSTAWIFLYVALFLVVVYFIYAVSVETFKEGTSVTCDGYNTKNKCENHGCIWRKKEQKCVQFAQ